MAVHFLVDGYNVIKQTPFLDCKKLPDARAALLSYIELYRPQGSISNSITVVFDGKEGVWSEMPQTSIRIVFTKHQSADHYIKSFTAAAKHPKSIRIVTNDKDIVLWCRSHGAQHYTVHEFMSKKNKERTQRSRRYEVGAGKITVSDVQKINEELRKLWLGK